MTDVNTAPDRQMRTFGRVWFGQLFALAATAVTDFVMSVWVLQETGSITQYSFVSVFIVAASILASPFLGVAADRRSRRGMLLASNSTAAIVAASVAVLDLAGVLQIWHVYLAVAVVSVCVATHFVVCQTLVGTMVPREQQGRAIGMLMIIPGFQIAAPVVGAFLFDQVGIKGVALIEVCVALLAIANLIGVRLPEPEPTGDAESPPSIASDLRFGVTYLRQRRVLFTYVILMVTVLPFGMGLAGLLIRPLILSFGSLSDLSLLTGLGGIGFLAGSILMSITGGPKRKAHGVWLGLILGGVMLAAHGIRPSVLLVAIVAPLFLVLMPVITVCSQTVTIRKLDPPVIGRIMGVTRTVSQLATAVSYLAAGPLVERVLNPAVETGGPLAEQLEPFIGTGTDRGVGLLYILCGVLFTGLGIYGWMRPSLRGIETVLPDPTPPGGPPPDDAPSQGAPADDSVAAASSPPAGAGQPKER